MLPRFYPDHLQTQLSANQYSLLNRLIELWQWHKPVRLERLGANLPWPIQFESRRRQRQRFLVASQLTIDSSWFVIISYWLSSDFSSKQALRVVVDRPQWREHNLRRVRLLWHQRALPLYWQCLPPNGRSSFPHQPALMQPVLPLLKPYQGTVLGDRELGSIASGQWLEAPGLLLCLRLRPNESIRSAPKISQQLSQVG